MNLEMKWFSNLKLIDGREQQRELEATRDELIPSLAVAWVHGD